MLCICTRMARFVQQFVICTQFTSSTLHQSKRFIMGRELIQTVIKAPVFSQLRFSLKRGFSFFPYSGTVKENRLAVSYSITRCRQRSYSFFIDKSEERSVVILECGLCITSFRLLMVQALKATEAWYSVL